MVSADEGYFDDRPAPPRPDKRRAKISIVPTNGAHYTGDDGPVLPCIRVMSGLRHVAADDGMHAMRTARVPFYQRDRMMVRAAPSKAKTADGNIVEVPGLMAVTHPVLARALGTSAVWERVNAKGEAIRIDPPKEVVEQIAALSGYWPFPPVTGVIGTPTMRPDGSILSDAGYDDATGLVLVAPPAMPPIPERPTRDDALAALEHLDGLLTEFPFADDASRSAALSMLLSPVLRGALGSAVPMHVVAAPAAGSGKSYLQDVASVLATGERCAVINVAPDPGETEKRLIGAALAGFPIIALDNCNGVLTGDFLAQVTERPILQLRPLGTSSVVRVTNVFTVFCNGNNIAVAADLVRRTIMCRLDANMESPEMREFQYDPVASILEDRGKYVWDCLVIARAFHCAETDDKKPKLASFEKWSDLVRCALIWLGKEDPVANNASVKAEDPSRAARGAIFAGWADALTVGIGYTVAEVIKEAEIFNAASGAFTHQDFRDALLSVAQGKNNNQIDGKRLGWWLHSTAKVITGDYKLEVDRSNENRPKWRIEAIQ